LLSTGRHSNTTESIIAITIAVIAPALRARDVLPCAVSKGGVIPRVEMEQTWLRVGCANG
jgi:hypothetical protein